jgi:hypothetical protein
MQQSCCTLLHAAPKAARSSGSVEPNDVLSLLMTIRSMSSMLGLITARRL